MRAPLLLVLLAAVVVATVVAAAAAVRGATVANRVSSERRPPDTDDSRLKAKPLRVHSVRPSPSSTASSKVYELVGAEALTVVFTRPVIALGSDWGANASAALAPVAVSPALALPLDGRWVTTAIYRLDAQRPWPAELEFALGPRGQLRAYDGAALSDADAAAGIRRYATRKLDVTLDTMYSAAAAAATGDDSGSRYQPCPGGCPSAYRSRRSGAECEWPAGDAVATLRFNSDVDVDMLRAASGSGDTTLRLVREADGVAVPLTIERCASGDAQCVRVRVTNGTAATTLPGSGEVDPAAARYHLVLEAGARFHPYSGALRARTSWPLRARAPFVLTASETNGYRSTDGGSRRIAFYLRHGLADNTTATLDALRAAITVSPAPAGGFTLRRPAAHRLVLEADFAPRTSYTLRVARSDAVRDAFGQPLLASTITYSTGEQPSYTIGPAGGSSAIDAAAVPLPGFGDGAGFGGAQRYNYYYRPSTSAAAYEPAGAPADYTYLHRGHACGGKVRGVAVHDGNLGDVLGALHRTRYDFAPAAGGAETTRSLPDTAAAGDVRAVTLPAATLAAASGAWLREELLGYYQTYNHECSQSSYRRQPSRTLEQRADVAVHWLSGGSFVESVAFVTHAQRAGTPPVAGARVELWSTPPQPNHEWAVSSSQLASATTDADGLARFDAATVSRACGDQTSRTTSHLCALVVRYDDGAGKKRLYVEASPATGYRGSSYGDDERVLRGALFTDRRLYKERDTLYVKGYVREQQRNALAMAVKNSEYYVQAAFAPAPTPPLRAVVSYDAAVGAFNATLRVPADAAYGNVQLVLYAGAAPTSAVPVRGATASVVVADPRVPTGVLALERVDDVYSPLAGAAPPRVRVTTRTYTDAAVPRVDVTLRWRVERAGDDGSGGDDVVDDGAVAGVGALQPRPWTTRAWREAHGGAATPPAAEGEMVVTTDDEGAIEQPLALPADVAAVLRDGDTVHVAAEWIGPTRELIKAETSLAVRPSPLVVALRATTWAPVPGYAMGVFVDVRDADGASLRGAAAPDVTLRLWALGDNETLAIDAATGVLTPPARAPEASCDAPGGDAADGGARIRCTFTPRTVARYVLLAEARDADGVALQTAARFGKTRAEWARSPLRSLSALTALPERARYALGERVTLSFVSPCASAQLLLRYGNRYERPLLRKALAAPGEARVEFTASAAVCRGGCSATLLLVCARGAHSAPADLPVSALFDLGAPQAVLMRVPLNVDDDALRLDAAALTLRVPELEAPGGGADGALTAAAPGDTLTVEVATGVVGGGVRAQVHLFVVDTKILDLSPLPLPDAAAALALDLNEVDDAVASERVLVSSKTAARSLALWPQRAAADAWIVPRGYTEQLAAAPTYYRYGASDTAAADIDLSDDEYAALYERFVTDYQPCWRTGYADANDGNGEVLRFKSADVADALPQAEAAGGVAAGGAASFDDAGGSARSTMLLASAPGQDGASGTGSGTAAAGGSGGGGGKAPTLRGDDVRTPYSATVEADVADGVARFEVTLPDNISTFKLRALVVTSPTSGDGDGAAGRFGSIEGEVVSERRLSLEPSVPRVVRAGDAFIAGATVTPAKVLRDALPRDVLVTAFVDCNALDLLAAAEQRVTLPAGGGPVRVEWPFVALRVGGGALKFTVRDAPGQAAAGGGSGGDARQHLLPSLPPQAAVLVATSFAIAPGATVDGAAARHAEGLVLPAAVGGSGNLTLVAGVGRQPAIDALATRLLDGVDPPAPSSDASRYTFFSVQREPSGQELAAALIAPRLVAVHKDDGGDGVRARARNVAGRAASLLAKAGYTHASYGLQWYPPKPGTTPYYSTSLNAFALWAARAATERAGGVRDAQLPPESTLEAWRRGLDAGLRDEWQRAQRYGYTWSNWDTLALGFLARGRAGWPTPPVPEMSFDALLTATRGGRLSHLGRGMVALVLQREAGASLTGGDRGGGDVLRAAVEYHDAQTRVQGRTAYVTWTAGGQQRDAAVSAMALWLVAAEPSKRDDMLVEKLANGVARGAAPPAAGAARTFGSGGFDGPVATAYAAVALAAYDVSRGNDKPALALRAAVGGRDLLAARFTEAGQVPVVARRSFDDIAADVAADAAGAGAGAGAGAAADALLRSAAGSADTTIDLFAWGTAGEASVLASLSFVPRDVSTEPVYRGIAVSKVIRLYNATTNAAYGGAVTAAKPGQQVEITIEVRTPDDLYDVQLDDWLPGNVEAFSPNLGAGSSAGGDQSTTGFGGADVGRGGGDYYYGGGAFAIDWGYGWWWRSVWTSQEVRADRITAYSQYMNAGTHTLRVIALVVTPGRFALPPTKVYALGQPELLGLSAGGTFDSDKEALVASVAAARPTENSRCFRPIVPALADDAIFAPTLAPSPPGPPPGAAGAIAGAVIGGLLAVGLLVGACVGVACFVRSRRAAARQVEFVGDAHHDDDDDDDDADAGATPAPVPAPAQKKRRTRQGGGGGSANSGRRKRSAKDVTAAV